MHFQHVVYLNAIWDVALPKPKYIIECGKVAVIQVEVATFFPVLCFSIYKEGIVIIRSSLRDIVRSILSALFIQVIMFFTIVISVAIVGALATVPLIIVISDDVNATISEAIFVAAFVVAYQNFKKYSRKVLQLRKTNGMIVSATRSLDVIHSKVSKHSVTAVIVKDTLKKLVQYSEKHTYSYYTAAQMLDKLQSLARHDIMSRILGSMNIKEEHTYKTLFSKVMYSWWTFLKF